MSTQEISNTEDVIDSRDVISRIEELEETINDCLEDPETDHNTTDEQNELENLKDLENEASGSPDWPHGEALIRDSYFTEYCEDLCKNIGDIPSDLPWYIENHIDWDGVAREIQMDYMEVNFNGVAYFIRA